MKKLLITLIALLGLTSCGSNKPIIPINPVNPIKLVGLDFKAASNTYGLLDTFTLNDLGYKLGIYSDGSTRTLKDYEYTINLNSELHEELPYTFNDIGEYTFDVTSIDNPKIKTSFKVEVIHTFNKIDYYLNDSLTAYEASCSTLDNIANIESTYKDKNVTAIANEGFSYNKKLTQITLPKTITEIGASAFTGCVNLKSIEFIEENNIEKIKDRAFNNCAFTSFSSPTKLTYLGWQALGQNKNLKVVDLSASKSLTSINPMTFAFCYNLEEVNLSEEIKEIHSLAFDYCIKLETINFNGTKEQWYSIAKDSNWRNNSAIKKVKCFNGDVISLDEPEPKIIGTSGEYLADTTIHLTKVDENNHTYKIISKHNVVIKKIYLGDEEVTPTVTNLEFTLSNPDNKQVTVVAEI